MRSASRDGLFGMFFLLVLMLMPRPLAAQTDTIASECDTISTFPWEAYFGRGLGCWSQSGPGYWTVDSPQSVYATLNSNVSSAGFVTLTTPPLRLDCDSTGLRLWWKDRRTVLYPNLKVMVQKEDGTRDTLYSAIMAATFTQHSVSLASYVGQTVRITFEVRLSYSSYASRGILSEIGICTQDAPAGYLSAPIMASVNDNVMAVLNLTRGQLPQTYIWNSAMLGPLTGSDTLQLTYTLAGQDTLTVTASNAYGSITRQAVVRVYDCPAVAIPWREDFAQGDTASYNVCWVFNGWTRSSSFTAYDERGVNQTFYNAYATSIPGSFMLTQPVAIPAMGVEHLSLWTLADGPLTVRVSTTASTDTADYTDILLTVPENSSRREMWWRTANLAAYAGQTVRFGFFKTSGTEALVSQVKVDYDILPVIGNIIGPTEAMVDSVSPYNATILHGDTAGLTYTWHSSLLDTTITLNSTPLTLNYTTSGRDILTLVVSNAYGSDTVTVMIEVVDCSSVSVPYIEDFEGVLISSPLVSGSLPGCWGYNWNGSNASYGPHVIAEHQYISNLPPGQALVMEAGRSTGYGNCAEVVLPRMADSLQSLSVAFDYRFESSGNGTLTVGYYSDNTFTALQTMTPQGLYYRRDTVNLAAAAPDGRIALRWSCGNLYYAVVIDNIKVFHDSGVRMSRPETVSVDSITATTARITWAAVPNATAYHVLLDGVVDSVVSDSSFLITGLDHSSQYICYVASIAGNDTSAYSFRQFLTTCLTVELPYFNDFSNGDRSIICWSKHMVNSFAEDGTLYISRDLRASYYRGRRPFMTTPVIDHPGNELLVCFRLRVTSSDPSIRYGVLVVGAMTDPADPSTFIAIDTLDAGGGWRDVQFNTRGLDTTRVAISFYPAYESYSGLPVRITDLHIEASAPCAQLHSAESVVHGTTSASLGWQYDTYGDHTPQGVLITLCDLTSGGTTTFEAHGTDTLLADLPFRHTFRADLRSLCGSDTSVAISVYFELDTVWYRMSVASADTLIGTVSGDGVYVDGDTAVIMATPAEGYHFLLWNDSVATNPRSVVMTCDTSFTAYFAPDTASQQDTVWYSVSVTERLVDREDLLVEEHENVEYAGVGLYMDGATVTLTAPYVNAFKCPSEFLGWVFAEGDTIRENPYSFVVTSDIVVVAVVREGVGIVDVGGTSFALYPNPARGEVTLDCGGDAEAIFIDLHGREVLRTRCREGKNRIDIGSLPAGVYYVRLAATSASATLKLVIQ